MSRQGYVRGEMYTKILDSLLTIKEREQELRRSSFGINEAFYAFGLAFVKSMIRTPSRKTREVVAQPILVEAFAVRITKHSVIRILQQSAVTGCEGVSMQGKYKRGENGSWQNTHIVVQVRRASIT